MNTNNSRSASSTNPRNGLYCRTHSATARHITHDGRVDGRTLCGGTVMLTTATTDKKQESWWMIRGLPLCLRCEKSQAKWERENPASQGGAR